MGAPAPSLWRWGKLDGGGDDGRAWWQFDPGGHGEKRAKKRGGENRYRGIAGEGLQRTSVHDGALIDVGDCGAPPQWWQGGSYRSLPGR